MSVESQALYESASDILFDQDFSGRLLRANRAFERFLGVSRSLLMGLVIYDRIAPDHQDVYRQRILERIGGAPASPFEIEMLGDNGRVAVEVRLELTFTNGSPTGVRCIGRDIADQIRSRRDRAASDMTLLRQTEELATFSRYLQLLHRLSTTTYATTDDLFADYLATGCQIFSLECGAIVEFQDDSFVVRRAAGAFSQELLGGLARKIRDEETTVVGSLGGATFFAGAPIVVSEQMYGGLLFWSENTAETHPQAREIVEMMARGMESAIQQRRLTDELEYRAHHDSLTGLPNRSSLSERLQLDIEKARLNGSYVGVIFMDLDRFKEINDSLGHAAGDLALQEVAQRFRRAAQSGMLVARVGGDEFAAIVHNVRNSGDAAAAAERLLDALAEPINLNGHHRVVTASSGVAVFPDDGENGAALLIKADGAMYEGKQAGGNRVRVTSAPAGLSR